MPQDEESEHHPSEALQVRREPVDDGEWGGRVVDRQVNSIRPCSRVYRSSTGGGVGGTERVTLRAYGRREQEKGHHRGDQL